MIPERNINHHHSIWLPLNSLWIIDWAIPEKKITGGLRAYFFENPLEFLISLTLPLEIPDKTKLQLWKFHKILLDPLEISTRLNHQDSWIFHIIYSWSPL